MESEKGKEMKQQPTEKICCFLLKCIFSVLSVGPIPSHIAFIMDGNRRYAKKQRLEEGNGHRAGFTALMNMLKYCYELGVKYITIYAFSIDNFKRRPEEVGSIMQLMQEKIEEMLKEQSIVNRYGIRVYFQGNLKLLSDPVRSAAERAMAVTAGNSRAVLSICVAYTSTDEILRAVERSCEEKCKENSKNDEVENVIGLSDIDRNIYMAAVPDPDIIVRTSGATRLSNFLLWQSTSCLLTSPAALWPEIGFWHLVWAVLDFQRNYAFLRAKEKES